MFDPGSTGFMILGAILVFLMTPALAFFYGGLSRRKNVSVSYTHLDVYKRQPSVRDDVKPLTIVHLFPELLNLYGDGGNEMCIRDRG